MLEAALLAWVLVHAISIYIMYLLVKDLLDVLRGQ